MRRKRRGDGQMAESKGETRGKRGREEREGIDRWQRREWGGKGGAERAKKNEKRNGREQGREVTAKRKREG